MEQAGGRAFLDILDHITDLISIHDKDFTIAFVNKAFADHAGMPREEIVGEKCYKVVHGSNLPVSNCPHRQTLAALQPTREVVHDPKSGRTFSVATFPHYAPDGTFAGSVHMARDITDEREQLLHLVVRELRTGQAPFALPGADRERVGIHGVIDEVLAAFPAEGRLSQVAVDKRYGERNPVLLGSVEAIRRILVTVIANALDAMADRGTLTIATAVKDKTALIDVTDTGRGIAPEDIERIFKPFFSTKGDHGGTGLGLCVARVVAEEQQGQIEVLSSWEEKGTTFRISWPC